MPKFYLFYLIPFIVLVCTANSCQTQNGSTWFAIRDRENRSVFRLNDTLHLEISGSKAGRIADSAEWMINGEAIGKGLHLDLPALEMGLGGKKITTRVWQEEKEFETTAEVVILSDIEPAALAYEVINTYPHDTTAYTQGLFYKDGHLYESTGRKGESTLRLTTINGKVLRQATLPDDIFGEGACLLEDKIYQLSWKDKRGFIYNMNLEKTGEFAYPEPFDGWGLSTDGRYLILSDGSHLIRFLDPRDSMKVVRTIEVFDDEHPVKLLNELEYVNGILYANVYTKDYIVGIDPASGKVLLEIDLAGLLPDKAHYKGFDKYNYVLNGIAHDPSSGHFYLAGKKWPLLFEVRFSKAGAMAGR
ncbi:glutamine cyclotransferase [Anseongella ginsenosidimutans]|uniref:Glutamine cyclotransferase n=1 Tax=Anseongella ginsenosidimutans TaxID=496056 RepID=A0A4R3KZE7_9SPHI|nr:glutaminyl-peptide cyclotransferase [Anseongella ginsenosidimutans]TCS90000.1 glutamine cyclotransferase [Anseongella ginsenosidimutans]